MAFMRRRKSELKRSIAETRITIYRNTIRFTTEATRWFRDYLDMRHLFRAYKNLMLERAKMFEDSMRCLVATRGIATGFV